MTAAVIDLIPGQLVSTAGTEAMVVSVSHHPVWLDLALVAWKTRYGYSFDALDWRQDVGETRPDTPEVCALRWRSQMTGAAQGQGLTT